MTENLQKTQSVVQSESVPTLSPGDIIAENYLVKSILGRGGMSVVYLVEQRLLAREFALKVLDAHNQTEVAVRRFKQEARTASLLRHPNLVAVHDYGLLHGDEPYLIMDYINGPTLAQHLATRGSMAVLDVVALTSQIAFGLLYAHEEGIVHRDIKPGNIMLLRPRERAQEGTIKIVDFGIAKLTHSEDGDSQGLTKTGEIFGSPIYMSPEQCKGGKVDHRSDIYSLGCVVFECLTGSPPFVGESIMSTMVMRLTQEPKSLKESTGGIEFPPILEAIIKKMLMLEPSDRYQDVGSLISDLMQLQYAGGSFKNQFATQKTTQKKLQKPILKLSKGAERLVMCSCAALISVASTLTVDRVIYHEKPASVAVQPLSMPTQQIDSDIVGPFIPPTVTHGAEGFRVAFHSDVGDFFILPDTQGFKAQNVEKTVPDGSLVSIVISEKAGINPLTLKGLAPLSFNMIKFRSRELAHADAIASVQYVRKVNQLDMDGCDSVKSLNGLYDIPLLSLKTTGTRVSSTELMNMKCLPQLDALAFGPVDTPDVVLASLVNGNKVEDLCYRGPLNVVDSPQGRTLDIKDIELIAKIASVKKLMLWHCPIDHTSLKTILSMKKLENLIFKECSIGPDSLPLFKNNHLKYLELTKTGWNQKQQNELRKFIRRTNFVDGSSAPNIQLSPEESKQFDSSGITDIYSKDSLD